MTDYMMKTRTALIGSLLVCILVAVASQGAEEPSNPGLAMSGHPSARLCNQMCRQKPVVDKCQCSSKAALPSNPCQNKKCRFGTRCTAFGSRPVCLPMPKACLLPQMRGLCTGTVIRYYFNHRSGNCEPFVFGGCSPNANNFISIQLCQKICMMIQG
ncbi:four-domain proteases inhibitor-like [Haliotis cracherodii]|uniref:four-domain proteases inhibitor-like n=1 Tax=Haliotis cracherodii TaxID=6455 RepID=UPI0039EC2796